MKLLLDLGNSRCKYAVLEDGAVKEYATQDYGPFGKLYSIKSLSDKYSDADEIVISSVLSEEMNSQIKTTLLKGHVNNVFYLTAAEDSFGVKLAYADVSDMGVDRIAALIGAKEKYTGNCCIVDCGTAVTIDAMDAKGIHQGGVILPGIKTMRKALLDNTKIGFNDTEAEFNVLSKTTEDAIHTGCISAVVGGIDYVVNKMASDYDAFNHVVVTGGDAELIKSHLSISSDLDDTLVLDGLKVISDNL